MACDRLLKLFTCGACPVEGPPKSTIKQVLYRNTTTGEYEAESLSQNWKIKVILENEKECLINSSVTLDGKEYVSGLYYTINGTLITYTKLVIYFTFGTDTYRATMASEPCKSFDGKDVVTLTGIYSDGTYDSSKPRIAFIGANSVDKYVNGKFVNASDLSSVLIVPDTVVNSSPAVPNGPVIVVEFGTDTSNLKKVGYVLTGTGVSGCE